jgi:hypothetical protein
MTATMTALDDYQTVSEKITGEITIKENTQYNNIDADIVIVEAGIKAKLYGNIRKTLVLKKNSKVFLHGQFLGKLQDEGGRLYHFDE